MQYNTVLMLFGYLAGWKFLCILLGKLEKDTFFLRKKAGKRTVTVENVWDFRL